MNKPKYNLRHEFFNLSEEERNYRSNCHGIVFENTAAGTNKILVNGSEKTLVAGATIGFSTNSPEVLITTVFEFRAGTAPVSLFIVKEFCELVTV